LVDVLLFFSFDFDVLFDLLPIFLALSFPSWNAWDLYMIDAFLIDKSILAAPGRGTDWAVVVLRLLKGTAVVLQDSLSCLGHFFSISLVIPDCIYPCKGQPASI